MVFLVGAALSLTGAAAAQTTSSSSTTTSTPTSTIASSSTTTTVPNPCTGQPCTAEPPDAFLSGSGGEVRLDTGSSCWRSPTANADGTTIARCVDVTARAPVARLVVQAGETLTLRFSALVPTEVDLQHDNQTTPLAAGNPVRFRVDLPVGIDDVGFFTRWLQGDAGYGVRLDIRSAAGAPPATPAAGPIRLTG